VAKKKSRQDELFDRLRAGGLRKRAARTIARAGDKADSKRLRKAVEELRGVLGELESRVGGVIGGDEKTAKSPEAKPAAAKPASAKPKAAKPAAKRATTTRSAAAAKRSAAAKKAAATRAANRARATKAQESAPPARSHRVGSQPKPTSGTGAEPSG
jgi:hypothetical protein